MQELTIGCKLARQLVVGDALLRGDPLRPVDVVSVEIQGGIVTALQDDGQFAQLPAGALVMVVV